ncbi:hypothetical protein [Alteromonas sp. H39]|uniref:hypothetical protein n=1 Tax=Alteromonas sp. H39 TaxID=3389876 RepID=UPI0039E0E750
MKEAQLYGFAFTLLGLLLLLPVIHSLEHANNSISPGLGVLGAFFFLLSASVMLLYSCTRLSSKKIRAREHFTGTGWRALLIINACFAACYVAAMVAGVYTITFVIR